MDLFHHAVDIAASMKHTKRLSLLLLLADSALCGLIIWKIPYTEIDWQTYMQQVAIYLHGERDYTAIKGATGPLVYPAAHLYIYSALYWLTDGGQNVLLAQIIFAILYLGILGVVLTSYQLAKAPPYILPLLILSKRLHSIFLLRLFNDCFAVGALFIAIYAFQRRFWTVGSVAYSWGLGTKMTLLLAAPAVGILLLQALPFRRAIIATFLISQVQIILALPFLSVNAWGYMGQAFEFTRQFLWQWTVNWRFFGEETFLSREFSLILATANLIIISLFIITRWIRPSGYSFSVFCSRFMNQLLFRAQKQSLPQVPPSFILTAILSSMITGMLCARSLHYQFYAYIAWSTPFLLWKSDMHPIPLYLVWAAQEWAWNVYPSTELSSTVVVCCLGIQVFGAWWGTRNEFANTQHFLKGESNRRQTD